MTTNVTVRRTRFTYLSARLLSSCFVPGGRVIEKVVRFSTTFAKHSNTTREQIKKKEEEDKSETITGNLESATDAIGVC